MFGESMTEAGIEMILERARELHQAVRPRVISDDGLEFIAKDFKEFIRVPGMTHVSTSPVARTVRSATSRRRICSPSVSRRSTPTGIGGWRRRDNHG